MCGYLASAWKGVGDADDISAVDRISVATQSLNHEDVPSERFRQCLDNYASSYEPIECDSGRHIWIKHEQGARGIERSYMIVDRLESEL